MNQGWVVVREYDNRLAADFAAQRLGAANIPVQIDDAATGLFGPGFAGATSMGVRLLVPGAHLDEARALLEDVPPDSSTDA